jgi:transposase
MGIGIGSGSVCRRERYLDDRPGYKPVPAREILDAVLWILSTGAQWYTLLHVLPDF